MRKIKKLNSNEMQKIIDLDKEVINPEGGFLKLDVLEFDGDDIGELWYCEADEYDKNQNTEYNGYFVRCNNYSFDTKLNEVRKMMGRK